MHAEATAPDGAEGVFDVRPPAYNPMSCVKLVIRDGAEGAFGAKPLACIPNSSPSQARFKESTLMCQPCDLFHEGS
jgi:hypothetical protein